MISRTAQRLASFFAEKEVIPSNEKEIYAYGYEIMISGIIDWIITAMIALLTGRILETAVYMYVFMRLRGTLGGFHAKTYGICRTVTHQVVGN